MCVRSLVRTGVRALARRFFSAVSISTSCRRRVKMAANICVCASGRGRGSGRSTSAKCASTWASRASVLAHCPVALAKSRTCRGLTTTTGTPAAANAPVSGISNPPVASTTTSAGGYHAQALDDLSNPRLIVGDGAPALRAKGHIQLCFGHINTDKDRSTCHTILLWARPCLIRAPWPTQLFGLFG